MRKSRAAWRLSFAFLILCSFAHAAPEEAAGEVRAAMDRLSKTTYRQRDVVTGPLAAMGGAATSVVTEHAGDRTRLVSEIRVPNFGVMKTERVTVGSRAAVRTTAPALLAKLEEANHHLTVAAARSLLQQIVSVATAVQTGGMSAASWIKEATRAATTIKSTADARLALDRAAAGFRSWQPVVEDDEDDLMPPFPSEQSGSAINSGLRIEKQVDASGATVRYRRTPSDTAAAGIYSVLIVNPQTGYPIAEENFVNGQRMMRSEYFDIGAPIEIDVPDCLK